MPSAHVREAVNQLRLALFLCVDRPRLLPVAASRPEERPRRVIAFKSGLTKLVLTLVVSCGYYLAWCTAEQVSPIFAPVALILVTHGVFLCIYALEYFEIIDSEGCNDLIASVEGMSLVTNVFEPMARKQSWESSVRAMYARFAARLIDAGDEEKEE